MAHFAEIDSDNKVIRVLRVPDNQEHRGSDFLANDLELGGVWIQTSINTIRGTHTQGKTPLRKNFAQPNFTYDPIRDAFIPPKPSEDSVFNENFCNWIPPKPFPSWNFDEITRRWLAPIRPPNVPPEEGKKYKWDESTLTWNQIPR